MTLRLHNTLTRQKEDFVPLKPENVRMYVCGPTVYDYAHIGNARPVIVFDVLYRLLKHLYPGAGTAIDGSRVTYVRNITDIDDKINARAAETAAAKGISVEQARVEITTATAQQYLDDVTALGCLPPTHTPRATEYVGPMIAMIEKLVGKGMAYAADGHVLFDVSKKADYGKLSKRPLDEMIAGARVEVAPYKKNPMDFVLWKPSDDATPGWLSPWGRGRPGWHIECSAMGASLLDETFDIHGGGIDLMFPHHENEIAQSEGAHGGHALARYWLHNGFLQVEGEKMSKSLGNFVTIRELLSRVSGLAVRLAMLKTHYRQPLDWTEMSLQEARHELLDWSEQVVLHPYEPQTNVIDEAVVEALADDLNTSAALTRMRELFRDAIKHPGEVMPRFRSTAEFLGLKYLDKPGYFRSAFAYYAPAAMENSASKAAQFAMAARAALANNLPTSAELLSEIEKLGGTYKLAEDGDIQFSFSGGLSFEEWVGARIAARTAARKAKDFKESDRIRDELLAKGIVLKDGPTGTTWEVKR